MWNRTASSHGLLLITGLAISFLPGCGLLHELQPHRLWRWNYQDAPDRTSGALFSVPDRLEAPLFAPTTSPVNE
jgi:hypothetical protein